MKEKYQYLPFDENNIKAGMTVIAGNAFPDSHPELVKAKELGLEVIRYHDFLGNYMENFISIGVTGSHGKTSTTGLLAHVLSGHSPTSYLIGDGTGSGPKTVNTSCLKHVNINGISLPMNPIMQS